MFSLYMKQVYNKSLKHIFLERSHDKGWKCREYIKQSLLFLGSYSGIEMFYYTNIVLKFKYSKIANFI